MQQHFAAALSLVLKSEGSKSNDPKDPVSSLRISLWMPALVDELQFDPRPLSGAVFHGRRAVVTLKVCIEQTEGLIDFRRHQETEKRRLEW